MTDAFALLSGPTPSAELSDAERVAKEVYGIEGTARRLAGERDANFCLVSAEGSFTLKIANRAEDGLDLVAAALEHIATVAPDLPVPRVRRTISGGRLATTQVAGLSHQVILVDFLAGTPLPAGFSDRGLRADLAGLLARLDRSLQGFFHHQAGRPLLWDLNRVAHLRPLVGHLPADRQAVAEGRIDRFEEAISSVLPTLRWQAIHHDFNPDNLLVDSTGRLVGIVDFGDLVHGPLVADPAVAASYQCFGQDPREVVPDFLASYHRHHPLTSEEVGLVPDLVAGRFLQSILIGAWRATTHPENRDYILSHVEYSWDALRRLVDHPPEQLADLIRRACGFAPVHRARVDLGEALAHRKRLFGGVLNLSYDQPVRLDRGEGVWLYDPDGHAYLDAYNNVPHVGHARPEVVTALAEQAARLTTNTRYLVDEVLEYADRLAALFPPELSIVLFTNSGSEANDLAFRIARAVTGQRGIIITDFAYHGTTLATDATSPEEHLVAGAEPWVATVPAPSTAVDDYVPAFDAAVATLARSGHRPAAFICDSVFSSDGIFDLPPGYLKDGYARIRAAGGLSIADEVQAGLGRVGERFWGFAVNGVVPDIVTLGKPIGNGYPMAVVVTTPAIAKAFASREHFFSTFAGSPVAARVGMAVLDVLERDRLPAQAERVGGYLRGLLTDLARRDPRIGEVRGPGLFIGVAIVDGDGRPDGALAEVIQNAMRHRRILIGRTGPLRNVLKIRPPLVFEERHADLLVETLGELMGG